MTKSFVLISDWFSFALQIEYKVLLSTPCGPLCRALSALGEASPCSSSPVHKSHLSWPLEPWYFWLKISAHVVYNLNFLTRSALFFPHIQYITFLIYGLSSPTCIGFSLPFSLLNLQHLRTVLRRQKTWCHCHSWKVSSFRAGGTLIPDGCHPYTIQIRPKQVLQVRRALGRRW